MARWRFTSSAEGWGGGLGFLNFDSGLGSPARGCLSGSANVSSIISGLSITVAPGDDWSFRIRFIGQGGALPTNTQVIFEAVIGGGATELYNDTPFTFSDPDDDSGWLTINGTFGGGGPATLSSLSIVVAVGGSYDSEGYDVYFDTVIIDEVGLDYDFTYNQGGIPGSII